MLGHSDTQYPPPNEPPGVEDRYWRGMEFGANPGGDERLVIHSDRRTLEVRMKVLEWSDQARVITAAIDPVTQPYVSSTEYLDCADEVTLNNCDSAWYRFAFDFNPWCFDPTEGDLRCNVRNVRLSGTANVTPQGIAYLNGHRISGLMNNPGCDPNPDIGPNDPCYQLQDTGHDLSDAGERRILTSPTPDPFSSDDPDGIHHSEYFLFGENELIFGVVAGASSWRPTGLEFKADLTYDLLGDCELDGDLDVQDAREFINTMTGPR